MPSGLYFFATKKDLVDVFKCVDNDIKIDYFEAEYYSSPNNIPRYSFSTIPNLGISINGDHAERLLYAIISSIQIFSHEVIQNSETKYSVLGDNHNIITIWPGGLYKNECLIEGRIDMLYNPTDEAIAIYKIFVKHFKRNFTKIRRYYMGTVVNLSPAYEH